MTTTPEASDADTGAKSVIIGGGNKTRMVMDFLLAEGRSNEIHGIVDRNAGLCGKLIGGRPVLGSLEDLLRSGEKAAYAFCICLSELYFPDRAQLTADLVTRGQRFVSIISTRAHISPSANVGQGAILFPEVSIGTNATVGNCVTCMTGALIEHDAVVDDNVEITPRAILAGGSRVCSSVMIGIGATVFPRIRVGEHAIVGGCAVVTRDVAPYAVVAGNPARVLRVIES